MRDEESSVAAFAVNGETLYPDTPPFHPGETFPEYAFPSRVAVRGNGAYALVRFVLRDLGLDSANYGAPVWNPLGELIGPGSTVLVKPNLVLNRHPRGGDLNCLITHGSVVRAVMDYVYIALRGEGRVIVGDAPIQGTDFDEAVEKSGIAAVVEFYREHTDLDIALVDLRQVIGVRDRHHHIKEWKEVPGDPSGYVEFDLADDSCLAPIARDCRRFRVTKYRVDDTLQYHNEHSHKYVVAGSVLDADLVINLPKLKTHCKAGVTLGLKNFVGTVGRKQCLAHHRHGGAVRGGDEYPDGSRLKQFSVALENWIDGNPSALLRNLLDFVQRVDLRLMKSLGVNPLRDGGWHGNDTVWRMVLDLVRIAQYGTRGGRLADTPQREVLTIIDGIVAGENEGPLEATPKNAGIIVAGLNPALIDVATATLMGFDYQRIPLLREALRVQKWKLVPTSDTRHSPARRSSKSEGGTLDTGEVRSLPIVLNGDRMTLGQFAHSEFRMDFEPSMGWKGHIELD